MKAVIVLRHSTWDFEKDKLTSEGRAKCLKLRPKVGSFAIVVSSSPIRAQETATLLSGTKPIIDARAGINFPKKFGPQVAELRKTHPFGVAGAILSIPELHESLRAQSEAFRNLVQEILHKLQDEERGLIVSHDGPMVGLEKVLTGASFDEIDHTYGELEGFRIDETMAPTRL